MGFLFGGVLGGVLGGIFRGFFKFQVIWSIFKSISVDYPGNSVDSVDSEWRGPWLCTVNKGRQLHLTVAMKDIFQFPLLHSAFTFEGLLLSFMGIRKTLIARDV